MARTKSKTRTLGKYQLQEEIGRGGMATVYKATDTSLKRDVAVKVLHPHLLSHTEARLRFEREARAVARLKHESVVEVYDYSETTDGDVFLVMELINGITLRDFLDARNGEPLMSESAALIARKIFLALQVAHDEGIVHRDVKPENILIDNKGRIKLSDFGIAYLAGIGQMTTTGQILGSPTYMSPEHIESSVIDLRADIFSVGTILYEMTVGTPPFVGNSPHQIIKRVVEGYYDNPLGVNPCVSDGIASVIVKCLQTNPELRFSTAIKAAAALEKQLQLSDISDFEKEQTDCIQNLDKWQKKITPKIINCTLTQAKQAQSRHRLPEAMNHLNRVLAMESDNETALGIVNVLSKKRRLRRSVERTGVLLFIVLIVTALVWIISETTFDPNSATTTSPAANAIKTPAVLNKTTQNNDAVLSTESSKDSLTSLNNIDPEENAQTTPPVKHIIRRHPPRLSPVKATSREVLFVPHPMNVQVVIDGKDRFIYKISDRSRVLKTGNHEVTFIPADKRMVPLTRKFTLKKGDTPFTIRARLNWKPGILNIRSNTVATVSSKGRAIGITNKPINMRIQKGPSEDLTIMVSTKGYKPIQKQLNITAGEITEIQINLKKEHSVRPL